MPNRDISVSFEFFPPRTDKARVALGETADRLAKLGPAFMTVTYGAGGTTSDPTLNAVLELARVMAGAPRKVPSRL